MLIGGSLHLMHFIVGKWEKTAPCAPVAIQRGVKCCDTLSCLLLISQCPCSCWAGRLPGGSTVITQVAVQNNRRSNPSATVKAGFKPTVFPVFESSFSFSQCHFKGRRFVLLREMGVVCHCTLMLLTYTMPLSWALVLIASAMEEQKARHKIQSLNLIT